MGLSMLFFYVGMRGSIVWVLPVGLGMGLPVGLSVVPLVGYRSGGLGGVHG